MGLSVLAFLHFVLRDAIATVFRFTVEKLADRFGHDAMVKRMMELVSQGVEYLIGPFGIGFVIGGLIFGFWDVLASWSERKKSVGPLYTAGRVILRHDHTGTLRIIGHKHIIDWEATPSGGWRVEFEKPIDPGTLVVRREGSAEPLTVTSATPRRVEFSLGVPTGLADILDDKDIGIVFECAETLSLQPAPSDTR